jgi:hypothetical protein
MGPGIHSGHRLELLELTAHLIDGLVELQHTLLQLGIDRRWRRGGLKLGSALQIKRCCRLARRPQAQGLGEAALAATIGLAQQPPTQTRGPEHSSTEGAQQQAATGAGWALPWFSHGWVKGSDSP